MESPNKRLKPSPPGGSTEADFVSLSVGDDDNETATQYGYNHSNGHTSNSQPDFNPPRAPRSLYQPHQQHSRSALNDPRHAKDKPKHKHPLPNHEPWILVTTKFGRRFVHNAQTKESFWRFPAEVVEAVREFDALERQREEKAANARWAEEQLREMRALQAEQAAGPGKGGEGGKGPAGGDRRARRRRSESLQREDEEALMAELAAEAEEEEKRDAEATAKAVEGLRPKMLESAGGGGTGEEGSESEHEIIEVTDSEFESEDEAEARPAGPGAGGQQGDMGGEVKEDGPLEFGEDDIAYQLAAMEQDYEDEAEDMNDDAYDQRSVNDNEPMEEEVYEDDETTPEEAAATFRSLLTSHNISPFTPWSTVIANEALVLDDRYTVLSTTQTRKAVWESWVRDTAAALKVQRAKAEVQDPKIPYLAFLAEKASPKLYWPEFKRKFRKEAAMNERKLSDKEREKLYRDHINRLKLPERTRKADLVALLKSVPVKDLNKSTSLDALPQQVLGHLHFISLPSSVRDEVIVSHIASLPPTPAETVGEDEDEDGELTAKQDKEQRRQDEALRARAQKVEEERRKAEKAERVAKRDLREEEREIARAMEVGRKGVRG